MLVSTRRAADLLSSRVGCFEQARALLRAGAAGPGTVVGNAVAYDETRVQELASRPWVDEHQLAQVCPWGVHVARLAGSRPVDLARPWRDLADQVARQPALPRMTAVTHSARMTLTSGLPWVATVSGWVVLGAEATAWRSCDDGSVVFDLRPPGAWFRHLERRWFAFGRGRHWFFWDPCRLTQ